MAVEEQGSGGEIWPSYLGVKQTDPVLTVTAFGAPWSGYDVDGGQLTALEIYLRAKAEDGANVADASASHIKITATNGLVVPEGIAGGDNNPATTTLRIGLRAPDGNSDILTINTASAIT